MTITPEQLLCQHEFDDGVCLYCGLPEYQVLPDDYDLDDIEEYKKFEERKGE